MVKKLTALVSLTGVLGIIAAVFAFSSASRPSPENEAFLEAVKAMIPEAQRFYLIVCSGIFLAATLVMALSGLLGYGESADEAERMTEVATPVFKRKNETTVNEKPPTEKTPVRDLPRADNIPATEAEPKKEPEKRFELEKQPQKPVDSPKMPEKAVHEVAEKLGATAELGTPAVAYQILYMFQKEGRLIDLLMEDISELDDETLGGAIRPIHEGCSNLMRERLIVEPVMTGDEQSEVSIPGDYDREAIKLIGNVPPEGPFKGVLVHRGWRLKSCKLPELVDGWAGDVVAPAEVEIS